MEEKRIATDVLVIGGAGGGLRAAIEARSNGASVVLASKMPAGGSSSTLHIAGWITGSDADSEDELFRQIVHTGGYLNNQNLVEVLVKDVANKIPQLMDYGVPLDHHKNDESDMPGHYVIPKFPDTLRGYPMLNSMREWAESVGIVLLDNTPISSLITADNAVVGAVGVDLDAEEIVIISAKSIIIATGGGSYAFERNNNPPGTTGDGFVLAYNAGAEMIDMECVSFNLPMDLLDELLQSDGKPPESLHDKGLAHYFMGGVKIDTDCKTNVNGLFAAGEVTGGVFGAARLGGSAVADIIVFGARAGYSAAQRAKEIDALELDMDQVENERQRLRNITEQNEISPDEVFAKLRSILWRYIGITKTEDSLKAGLEQLSQMRATTANLRARDAGEIQTAIEASNILELGRILAAASLLRKETRGNYWRADYPEADNENSINNVVVYRDGDDIASRIDPVIMTRLNSPTQPPLGQGCFWYFPRLDIH